jgi:hypothetical protein
MNKVSTLALAGLVAVTATTNASMSRWDGFGDIGAAFIADVQDIWTLPGVVTNYKDAIYSELGSSSYDSDVWGGAHFTLGPGVLAVWANRPYSEGGFQSLDVPAPYNCSDCTDSIFSPQDTIDLIYGWALSEETTLAVGLNRAARNYERKEVDPGNNDDWKDFENSSDLGIALGLEQKNVGPISLLEVGLTYNMLSGEMGYKESQPGTEDDKVTINGTDLDLRIGGDMVGEDGAFSRVELGLNMDSANGKYSDDDTIAAGTFVENKYNGFGYNVGYAAGKSSDKGLGLLGLMLSSRSDGYEGINQNNLDDNEKTTYSMFKLAAGFAAESKVNSWLTIRGGLTNNLLHSTTYERVDGATDKDTDTWTSSEYNWFDLYGGQDGEATFGFSVTVGSVTFDAVLEQSILWNGPYFVTGTSSGLANNLSATWVY